MASTTLIYDPVAPCVTPAQGSRRSLDTLAGKTIGFIDNSKPNFNHLVEHLGALLTAKHGVSNIVVRRKRSASQGASEAVMNELVEQCDAIVTGSGD
jgi:hypothetical protein